jgi:hypothetical protein
MAQSNWAASDPYKNHSGQADRAARQQKAKQLDRAAHTAGRGKRRI